MAGVKTADDRNMAANVINILLFNEAFLYSIGFTVNSSPIARGTAVCSRQIETIRLVQARSASSRKNSLYGSKSLANCNA